MLTTKKFMMMRLRKLAVKGPTGTKMKMTMTTRMTKMKMKKKKKT